MSVTPLRNQSVCFQPTILWPINMASTLEVKVYRTLVWLIYAYLITGFVCLELSQVIQICFTNPVFSLSSQMDCSARQELKCLISLSPLTLPYTGTTPHPMMQLSVSLLWKNDTRMRSYGEFQRVSLLTEYKIWWRPMCELQMVWSKWGRRSVPRQKEV